MLPSNVVDLIVDFLPVYAVANARAVSLSFSHRIAKSWVTLAGIRQVLAGMLRLRLRMLEADPDDEQFTPPVAWHSGGRACDEKLQKLFTRGGEVVPFHRLTGSLMFALQRCWEVNASNSVAGMSFCPDQMISSHADVDKFFQKCFEGSERPPANHPEDARVLWAVLRWVLCGLIHSYTFTKFYAERTGSDDQVECQLWAWLWEPKVDE